MNHGLNVQGNTFGTTTSGGIDLDDVDTHPRSSAQSLELNGHSISYNDDFTEFECVSCDEEFAVPDIFQASTGFRQIVYQLYIFAHFKNHECPSSSIGSRLDELMDQTDNSGTQPWPPNTTTPPNINPGDTFWVDGLNDPVYYYDNNHGDNYWMVGNDVYETGALIESLPPKSAESFVAETGLPGAAEELHKHRQKQKAQTTVGDWQAGYNRKI